MLGPDPLVQLLALPNLFRSTVLPADRLADRVPRVSVARAELTFRDALRRPVLRRLPAR